MTSSPITCEGCGETLTRQYARVFGDEDDVVHACLHCEHRRRVSTGAAAGLEPSGVKR